MMKKRIALFLALVMCSAVVVCAEAEANNGENETTEVVDSTEYAIGDAFGTDSVECVIKELTWITSEEFVKNAKKDGEFLFFDKETVFPGYETWGQIGILEEKVSDNAFMCVTYSLQNVGKEAVSSELESNGFGGYTMLPYGTIAVIYDDGYTFEISDSGFTRTLDVLRDAITEGMMICLPNQVYENEDKPLKLRVTLPTSSGETQEFMVDANNIEKSEAADYQEEAYQEAVSLMENNKYSSATELLMGIQGYKDADTLLLECCVKGWEGFDYLKDHKDEFNVIADEELTAELISASWVKSDGETWQFFEDGTLDTGRTKPADGTKVIWNWSVQGDTLWLGTVDKTLKIREVYDDAFVGFNEDGSVYISMWKVQ